MDKIFSQFRLLSASLISLGCDVCVACFRIPYLQFSENLNSTTHFSPVRPAFNLNSCCREPDNNNTGDEKYVDGIVIINPDDDNTNQSLNNLNNDCDSKDVYNNLNVNELVKLSHSSHYEKSFDSDNSYAKRQIEMYENDNSSYVKKGFFGKSPVSTIQSDNTELRGDCNNAKEGVSVADTRPTTQIPSKIPRSSKIPTPCKNVLTKPREKLVRFGTYSDIAYEILSLSLSLCLLSHSFSPLFFVILTYLHLSSF